MISPLAQALAARLQSIFDTVKVQIAPFPAAPGKAAIPALAIYPGKLIIQQAAREVTPTAREVTVTQDITLGQKKTGPYPLDAPPKVDSLRASLVGPGNALAPLAPADFRIDYDQTLISFPTSKTAAGNLVKVEFSSTQVTRQREFQQELWLETYDSTGAEAEKLAGLACSVTFNTAAEILAAVNGNGQTRKKAFSVAAVFRQLQLLEGAPLFGDSTLGYRLKFNVAGDLLLTQMFQDSLEIIKEVIIDKKIS